MLEQILELCRRYRELIMYTLCGVLTLVINIVLYWLCYTKWGISNDTSVVIACVVAVLAAFFTNKPFVFESHDWSFLVTMREAVGFFGCRFGTGVLEWILMHILVTRMALPGTPMKALVNVIVILLNYVTSKFLVFSRKRIAQQRAAHGGDGKPGAPGSISG